MHSPFFLREQLQTAIAAGDLAAVAAIVDECKQAGSRRFADVFSPDDHDDGSRLPLFEAVRTGQGAIVSLLLEQGCELEQRDKMGATPLHQAYSARQVSIAGQLIAAGADIRATTKLGTRVLDTVLASGNMEQVDWFVRQGVALASVNGKGNTALHFACRSGNIELAMRIHDSCAIAFDCAAQDGRRPLDACGSYALFAAIVQRYPAIALDIGFEDGSCSLHEFARRGCTGIVCHLLDAGCDGDRLVAYKNTLMHSAVASHKADLVQELLRRKLKVEGRNAVNYRPLHWAAEQGDLDIVRLLVEQGGAKVNIKGKLNFIIRESKTPLYMAIDEGHADVARYLVDRGADLNALNDQANRTAACAAAGQGDSALLRYLLERGASPNGVNRDPDSVRGDFSSFPLANAANAAVVDVLVEFGVDLDAHDASLMRPESALRCLVGRIEKQDLESERGRGRLGAIEALLRHGARLSDGVGQIVDDARCVEVSRLLRAAERRELAPAATPAQVEAGDEHRSGLGITLFQQSLHCSKADQLAMFIETLRDAGSADVNYVSEDGNHHDETILHRVLDSFRCYEPDGEDAPIAMLRDCVKLLLDKGANPDAVETLNGETPYHKVAKMTCSAFGQGRVKDDFAVLDILADFSAAGADPNLPNEEGANVIDLLRHPALVSWMRAHQGCHGAYPAALFDVVSAYQPDLLAALIGDAGNWRGVNAHGCNLLGWWAMDATGEANWPNALRTLDILEGYGFVVNAAMEEGRTALWLACQEGAMLQAEWLFSHYAWDLNAQDDGGCVPLAALVAASFPEFYGDAMTPKAFRTRRDALAVAMVRQGVRIDVTDRDGKTPLSRCTTVALRSLLERTARAVETAAQKS